RMLLHSRCCAGNFDSARGGAFDGFAGKIVSRGKSPCLIHQHAYPDAHRLGIRGMANFAVLGGQPALAVVDNASIAISGAPMCGSIERPTGNLLHRHESFLSRRHRGTEKSKDIESYLGFGRLCAKSVDNGIAVRQSTINTYI